MAIETLDRHCFVFSRMLNIRRAWLPPGRPDARGGAFVAAGERAKCRAGNARPARPGGLHE